MLCECDQSSNTSAGCVCVRQRWSRCSERPPQSPLEAAVGGKSSELPVAVLFPIPPWGEEGEEGEGGGREKEVVLKMESWL